MSPADRGLRLVELLPGGEQITSRPIRAVVYMDDQGAASVRMPTPGAPEDVLALLATLLAAAATWFGAPPAVVAYRAMAAADHIYMRGARDE